MAALAWILPAESALLTFSEAETNLLLPAPVTRRQLLVHRLLRSQLPLLFGAVVSAVFVPLAVVAAASLRRRHVPPVRHGARLFHRRDDGPREAARAGRAGAACGVGAARTAAERRRRSWASRFVRVQPVDARRDRRRVAVERRPGDRQRAGRGGALAVRGGGAAAVCAAPTRSSCCELPARSPSSPCTIEWVLWSDESYFAEAPNRPQSSTRTPAIGRGGACAKRRVDARPLRANRNRVSLEERDADAAAHEPALGAAVRGSRHRVRRRRRHRTGCRRPRARARRGARDGVADSWRGSACCSDLKSVRSDLRGDLRHLDVLKTWPVKSAAVIRGEMLWPTLSLTLCAWFALALRHRVFGSGLSRS